MNKIIITKIPKFIISQHIIKTYKNNNEDNFQFVEDILSKFEETNSVILVGQVQSGKTKQIIEIIQKAFDYKYNYDLIVYLSGKNKELNNQVCDRLSDNFSNVSNAKDLRNISKIQKLIIVSIKDKKRLNDIIDFIYSNKTKLNKILVIDDESDYGSINNSKDKDDLSIIYKNVYDEIYNLCYPHGGVLKVTATPFVNILTEKDFLLKDKNPFLFSMPTNNEYTGVKFFNSLKNDFWFTSIDEEITNKLSVENREEDILKAYFIWVYKSYLLYCNKNIKNYNRSDLLINISYTKNNHNKIADIIGRYCGLMIDNSIIKAIIKEILNKEIDTYISDEEYEKIFDFYFNIFCQYVNVSKFNGDKLGRELSERYNVIIGGNLLSRGKTFENLVCELITIKSDNQFNYDLLLQKCRWFGYRKERSRYMAVICNKEIKKQLENVETIINLFHHNNLGYELNYTTILKTLREKEDLFTNASYTTTGKIK